MLGVAYDGTIHQRWLCCDEGSGDKGPEGEAENNDLAGNTKGSGMLASLDALDEVAEHLNL